MANNTYLSITAFGTNADLYHFDQNPPKMDDPKITIDSTGITRIIESEFKSQSTLSCLIEQIKGLSLLITIEIEPAFCSLLHRDGDQTELQTLFEIPDFRDDEFFQNLRPAYLNSFHKPILDLELIQLLSLSPIGNTYLDLQLNPETYLNK